MVRRWRCDGAPMRDSGMPVRRWRRTLRTVALICVLYAGGLATKPKYAILLGVRIYRRLVFTNE